MKGYIYKLCCKDLTITDIYIGSTRNFARRKARHKSSCNTEKIKEYNYNVYKFIRANGNFQNWDMVLIEKGEFEETIDLHKRERYWIETLGANLNTSIPNKNTKRVIPITEGR